MKDKVISIIVMVLFSHPLKAEQDSLMNLEVGDSIPEEFWNLSMRVVNHPDEKDVITLQEYREKKLIIIDFWATWCGVCVESLDKAANLNDSIDNIQVIFVTNEEREKIRNFHTPLGKSLFSVIEKNQLKNYFPHQFIPHQVWIMDGKVVSITGDKEVTESNILEVLQGNSSQILQKKDMIIDYFVPLSIYAEDSGARVNSFSCFTGYMEGTGNTGHFKQGDHQSFFMLNRPIFSMYSTVIGISNNRIAIESSRKNSFFYYPDMGYENVYCYQLITEIDRSLESLRKQMINDLNTQFKLNGRFEKKLVETYVIRSNEEGKYIKTHEIKEERLKPYSFEIFVKLLNFSDTWEDDYPIILDESNFSGCVFAENPNNIKALAKNMKELGGFLADYGLYISKEKRTLDIFVISDIH